MWGHSTYLILILVWAGPIIVFQWLLGADLLLHRWKVLIPGIMIPTLYLTCMDSLALRSGTWTISPQQSFNVFLPVIHVPVEEGLFFLVTNTLVVQAMIFLLDRARVQNRVRQIAMHWKMRTSAQRSVETRND
jgi:lycopene cyclase domain-containing protein